MPETDGAREAIVQLLEYSRTTSMVVTIQLIAAILMIGVEACLLWGILKAVYVLDHKVLPSVDSLVAKMRYLTVKVEVILEAMGHKTASKIMEGVAEGDDADVAIRKALEDARDNADLGPLEATQ